MASHRAADRDTVRARIDAELARLYSRTDLPKALERARSAAEISRAQGPSLEGIDALRILGEVARLADQPEQAREALVEALAWTDRFKALGVQSVVLGELGSVQNRLGQLEAAAATLTRAAALAERLGDAAPLHMARFSTKRGRCCRRKRHRICWGNSSRLAQAHWSPLTVLPRPVQTSSALPA